MFVSKAFFIPIFFFITLNIILGAQSVCDKSKPKPTTFQIQQKILCGYDRQSKPVKVYTNTTNVQFDMRVMFLVFNEQWNSLQIHSWSRYGWKDEFLVWEKNDYEGVATLQIQPSLIWLPDISVHTPSDIGSSFLQIANRRCWLKSSGFVVCVIPTVYSAYCNADIRLWPFDTHNCTMRLGSWSSYTYEMNISLFDSGVSFEETHGFNQVGDWTLLNATAVRKTYGLFENRSSPYVEFSFVVKRNSGVFASTVILPSIVLALVTTIVFWLDANSLERMGLMCLNILCHCLYLQYLGYNLPSNGETSPVILVFFRDSLLMVASSLVITLLIRCLEASTSSAPSFITLIVNGVLNTPPGQLLLMGGVDPTMVGAFNRSNDSDETNLVETTTKLNTWRLFAIILDRVAFIIFSIVIAILLTKFIPEN